MQRAWRRGPVRLAIMLLALGAIPLALSSMGASSLTIRLTPSHRLPKIRSVPVRRIDWLTESVTAAGQVASRNNAVIRCALERVVSPGAGGSVSANGSSTILSLIPDGSMVKEGDLLCELDSSDYEELVRRQTIGVKKATAEHLQAKLNLEIAEIALRSYLDGSVRQAEQSFEGQVALTTSGLSRQTDRVAWAQRMLTKGYASLSQVTGEQEQLLRLQFELAQIRMSYDNHVRYTLPRDIRSLESHVTTARAALDHQTTRLKLEEERLMLFEEQVKRCTIRAPNDGFVIYANRPGRPDEIWEGASVRQRQRLFYLPDLSQMEVQAMIHETVVNEVGVGMPAMIRFEALPDRQVEGHVTSVAPLPFVDENAGGTGVKYYLAEVQLDQIPSGLRPGMSAELKIITSRHPKVLVLPPIAISVEGGQDICYVIGDEGIERRAIEIGERNEDFMQIVGGLEEGERIVLEPSGVAAIAL